MNSGRKFLIYLLFILSGATSLIYQSVWVRLLSLSVGSTSASISLVLAIFFFGLAAGSYIAGGLNRRILRPIRFYGVIEGLIGVYSVGLVYIFLNLHHFLALFPHQGTYWWVGAAVKYVTVGFLLLPPTVCMGASLPLLVRVFQQSSQSVGRKVSFLYFINTLGAVCGAFAGSFILIPNWGVLAANHGAAVGNGVVLLVALALSRTSEPVSQQTSSQESASDFGLWRRLSVTQQVVLLISFATGFSSIAAEVVWNKYLGIFFGTNIYGLGLILSIFLSGIAFGSLALSWVVDRVQSNTSLFLGLAILAVLALFAASHALNYLPLAANVAAYYVGGAVNLLTIKSLLSALVIFPPTFVFGALFPLGVDLLSSSEKDAPAAVGLAYAINTVGSISGSYLGGMLLIPLLGSSGTISLALVVLSLAAIFAFLKLARTPVVRRNGALVIAVIAVLSVAFGSVDFRNIIKSAYFQTLPPSMTFSDVTKYFAKDYEEFSLISEGKTAIISLSQDPKDGPQYKDYYRLKTNGLNESIYNKNALTVIPKYEGLLGMLPYALKPGAENTFVVGFGGGYTVGLLTKLNIPRVQVAELEEGIIDAAQYVYNGKNPILERANLNLTIEDARFVLATKQGGPYDIIVSQPSHSWLSGVANLFTKEFFEIVKGNLKPDGVFSQWLNLYNMDDQVLRSIMHTFFEVFPNGFVFTDRNDEELIMIGSMAPLKMDINRLKAMTADPELAKSLSNLPFSSPEAFLSNFATSRAAVVEATRDAPTNTDINAYAEVNQSALFYSAEAVAGKPQSYLAKLYSGDLRQVADHFPDGERRFFYETLLSLQKQTKFFKFNEIYEVFQKLIDNSVDDLLSAGYLAMQAQRYATAKYYFSEVMKADTKGRSLDYMMGTLVETKRWDEAVELFEKNKATAGPFARCYYAEAAVESKGQTALKLLRTLKPKLDTNLCDAYGYKVLGKIKQAEGDYTSAVQQFENFYAQFPQDVGVVERLTSLNLLLGREQRGREFAGFLSQIHTSRVQQLTTLAQYYQQRGYLDDALILSSLEQ